MGQLSMRLCVLLCDPREPFKPYLLEASTQNGRYVFIFELSPENSNLLRLVKLQFGRLVEVIQDFVPLIVVKNGRYNIFDVRSVFIRQIINFCESQFGHN